MVLHRGIFKSKKNKGQKTVFIEVTYQSPILKYTCKIITESLHLLFVDEEVKRMVMPVLMTSFRSVRKLSNNLDRSKLSFVELATFFSSKEDSVRHV